MPATTYYELLEVPQDADQVAVRRGFMKLAQQWHPDKAPEADREAYEARFRRISEAYEILSDPLQRERYDRERAYRQRRPVTYQEPRTWSPRTVTVEDDDYWHRIRWEEARARAAATSSETPFTSSWSNTAPRTVNPIVGFSLMAILMGIIAIVATIALGIWGLFRLGRFAGFGRHTHRRL